MNDTNETKPPELPKTTPEPVITPLPAEASIIQVFENLLKSPTSLIKTIETGKDSKNIISKLLILIAIGFFIFGITLGSFSFGTQLWAAPLKTLIGITIASIICLPSLYIFSSLTGTNLKLAEIAQGIAASIALMAALLLGFTPVLWVFSQSTESEAFFGTLVIITWIIALIFGIEFLLKMLKQSGIDKPAPIYIWIGIFTLVTLQMSTTLRPIIGTSDEFFTGEKLFFLEHWLIESSSTH